MRDLAAASGATLRADAAAGSRQSSAGLAAVEGTGLDGDTTSTVEQIGTYAQCAGGTPNYFAFYEMYPSGHRYNVFSPYWKNDKIFEVDSGNQQVQAPSKLEGAKADQVAAMVIRRSPIRPSGPVSHTQ